MMQPAQPRLCKNLKADRQTIGALFVVKRQQFAEEPLHVRCLQCQRTMYPCESANGQARSFSKKALLA